MQTTGAVNSARQLHGWICDKTPGRQYSQASGPAFSMKIAAVDGRNNRNSSTSLSVLIHAPHETRTTTTCTTLLSHFNVGQRPYFEKVPPHDGELRLFLPSMLPKSLTQH